MDYLIKKIDSKTIEYNLINCDTCRIYQDGVGICKYNFFKNEIEIVFSEWDLKQKFENLTKRQKNLVLKYANIYFLKLYKKTYYNKLKKGEFFAPTDENIQKQLYFTSRIAKIKENIKKLEK